MKVSYYYEPSCDWYVKLMVQDGFVTKRYLTYYYGHTNIPPSGRLTNKTKSVTILYQKLLEVLNVSH